MEKRILYFADPNSVHDIKWISFFASEGQIKCYLLPRLSHYNSFMNSGIKKKTISDADNFQILSPINDFSIVRFYRTLYDAYLIRRIILKEKIDVIHILYSEPNALWCLLKFIFSIPMIITTRGTDVLKTIPESFEKKDILNRVVAWAYKLAFKQADWVSTTSETQVKSIVHFSGRRSRMSIIRTGVDIKRLQEDTSLHFPLRDSSPFLLFPRQIKPLYNHEFSLAALDLLPARIKEKYKVVFVGKNAGDMLYQERLEKIMNQQKEMKIEFIEEQDFGAICELYKRAALVIMTPRSDGSPVSAMEALICGSKLILGPLEYDSEVFSKATRLKRWDISELAATITDALDGLIERPVLSEGEKNMMDLSSNMRKMIEIYDNF